MSAPAAARSAATNADLVRAVSGGDAAGWEQLIARYTALLFRIARSYGLSPAASSDVVQTAWLRLLENVQMLRKPESVGSWLASTVRHESLAQVRQSRRERAADDCTLDRPDPAASPQQAVCRADLRARVAAALDRLSQHDRRLLHLLSTSPPPSYAEISATLGMPIGSIGPTRARALARLRLELTGVGVDRHALGE